MFTTPTYHQLLGARLRTEPAFAFSFARQFRDIPPIAPHDMMQMAMICIENLIDDPDHVSFADVVIAAKVQPDAEALPGREPWPQRWGLLIDVVDEWPPPTVLLRWP